MAEGQCRRNLPNAGLRSLSGKPDAWDLDGDGVLEGRQHHTLDMELFGPSSWLEGFYLLALDVVAVGGLPDVVLAVDIAGLVVVGSDKTNKSNPAEIVAGFSHKAQPRLPIGSRVLLCFWVCLRVLQCNRIHLRRRGQQQILR